MPLQSDTPLCIDVDGTLVMTDTLMESLMNLLKNNPILLLSFPFWILKGKAYFKRQVAKRTRINVETLPYCRPLLEFLAKEKKNGRLLILVTATDALIANRISDHLGLFSEVLASDGTTNLSGKKKAEKLVKKFGSKRFSYAANSNVDMPVWSESEEAIAVNASSQLIHRIKKVTVLGEIFDTKQNTLLAILRSIRPHQWLKNILILIPLITAHRLELPLLQQSLYAFFSFSLCTSSVYLINDLMDLESDRLHPKKKTRPLAAGGLPLHVPFLLIPFLLFGSIAIALFLPPSFLFVLATYFILTISYSFFIKQIVLVDVLLLAGLYTLRIIAGHTVTGLEYSLWLLVFSMFFFFSLALVKRFSELLLLDTQAGSAVAGRGYILEDRETIATLGIASGYISVLVLALYITSDDVALLYNLPTILLLICPLMLYWISRIWLIAHRGKIHDDPVIFTLKDSVSYVVGVLILCVMFIAT